MSDPDSARVVLVTGASRGIGAQLAQRFVKDGWTVVGCSRTQVDVPDGIEHHVADVSEEGDVIALMAAIRRRHGRLDAVINNAGIASMNHSLLTTTQTADRILRVNVLGSFLVCREAARLMRRAPRGRIVNFSSVAVPLLVEGEAVYAASKSAVETLTGVLARELAPLGITVNAIGPTPIATDLIEGVGDASIDALVRRQAIPRLGDHDDVWNVVEFFLRAESDFVTGQTIYLGGVT